MLAQHQKRPQAIGPTLTTHPYHKSVSTRRQNTLVDPSPATTSSQLCHADESFTSLVCLHKTICACPSFSTKDLKRDASRWRHIQITCLSSQDSARVLVPPQQGPHAVRFTPDDVSASPVCLHNKTHAQWSLSREDLRLSVSCQRHIYITCLTPQDDTSALVPS